MPKSQPQTQARYRERLREAGKVAFYRVVTKVEAKALQQALDEMRRKK